ncbi:methyltransferase domain-containing protein [bacterium]|nr:methyltransferase domain-containing protein [bacterium]
MSTTKINPGSFTSFKIKTPRSIIYSVKRKIKGRQYRAALRTVLTDGINYINRNKYKTGTNYFCPVCNNQVGGFAHLSNELRFSWNSVCIKCSSRSRHRGLIYAYKKALDSLNNNQKILHFAPEPIFYPLIESYQVDYKTTDFFLQDVDYPNEDIQALSFSDNSFDLLLCNHVIEHVENDRKAVQEMYRILNPGGTALITVPGDFKRKNTIYFEHLKFNGHYRDYGLDFLNLLKQEFDDSEMVNLDQYDDGRKGIKKNEMLFIASKLK